MSEIKAALSSVASQPRAHVEELLNQRVAVFDSLKALHLKAEDEYNQAARILIESVKANHEKLNKSLAKARSENSKLKHQLVHERLASREELESLRLRLLGSIDAENFETGEREWRQHLSSSSSDSEHPSSRSESPSPSTFSVVTDTSVEC